MKNTRIIHICNDYSKQTLYRSLFLALLKNNIEQEIYVPVRSENEIGKNLDSNLMITQSHILKPLDRIMFRRKIKKIHNDFLLKIKNFSSQDIIHAHFLYSDGAVALSLKKAFQIKYIVAVRNTDLNYFLKLRPDLYFLMVSILKEAEKVIFLNHGYKNKLLNFLTCKDRSILQEKFLVIPNGINEDWLTPINQNYEPSETIKLLYVGDFSKNKNVRLLIKAFAKMKHIGIDVSLKLAGGGGSDHDRVIKLLSQQSSSCEYLGKVNISELKKLYGSSDILVVPSKYETFGMVFIEALSQGCKVIYTEGEAISGLIGDKSIAIGLPKINSSEIIKSIIKLYENKNGSRQKCIDASKQFSLAKLSSEYSKLYKEIL
jgi:L-malate glycosyltransferase